MLTRSLFSVVIALGAGAFAAPVDNGEQPCDSCHGVEISHGNGTAAPGGWGHWGGGSWNGTWAKPDFSKGAEQWRKLSSSSNQSSSYKKVWTWKWTQTSSSSSSSGGLPVGNLVISAPEGKGNVTLSTGADKDHAPIQLGPIGAFGHFNIEEWKTKLANFFTTEKIAEIKDKVAECIAKYNNQARADEFKKVFEGYFTAEKIEAYKKDFKITYITEIVNTFKQFRPEFLKVVEGTTYQGLKAKIDAKFTTEKIKEIAGKFQIELNDSQIEAIKGLYNLYFTEENFNKLKALAIRFLNRDGPIGGGDSTASSTASSTSWVSSAQGSSTLASDSISASATASGGASAATSATASGGASGGASGTASATGGEASATGDSSQTQSGSTQSQSQGSQSQQQSQTQQQGGSNSSSQGGSQQSGGDSNSSSQGGSVTGSNSGSNSNNQSNTQTGGGNTNVQSNTQTGQNNNNNQSSVQIGNNNQSTQTSIQNYINGISYDQIKQYLQYLPAKYQISEQKFEQLKQKYVTPENIQRFSGLAQDLQGIKTSSGSWNWSKLIELKNKYWTPENKALLNQIKADIESGN